MPRRPPSIVGGDRNVRVLRQHQHTQFVERVRAGLVTAQDRFSKPLSVGDLIMWHPQIDVACTVVSIEAAPLAEQLPEESTRVLLTLAVSVREPLDVRGPAVYFAQISAGEAPAADTGPQADAQPESAPETPQPLSGDPEPAPPAETAEPSDDHTD